MDYCLTVQQSEHSPKFVLHVWGHLASVREHLRCWTRLWTMFDASGNLDNQQTRVNCSLLSLFTTDIQAQQPSQPQSKFLRCIIEQKCSILTYCKPSMFKLLYCIVTKAVKLEELKKLKYNYVFIMHRLDYIPNNTSFYKKKISRRQKLPISIKSKNWVR